MMPNNIIFIRPVGYIVMQVALEARLVELLPTIDGLEETIDMQGGQVLGVLPSSNEYSIVFGLVDGEYVRLGRHFNYDEAKESNPDWEEKRQEIING